MNILKFSLRNTLLTFQYLPRGWAIWMLALIAVGHAAPSPEAVQRATQGYQLGNAAYEKNDYSKAADLYRSAIDEGIADSRLYFNYANAEFRLNRLGLAILYYEKARKLDPNDEDVSANLLYVNAQIIDKNPTPEINSLTRALIFAHEAFSINEGLWISLVLFSLIFLCGILSLYFSAGMKNVLIGCMVLCGLGLATLSPSLFLKIREQETLHYGIVLKPAVEMFSGPGETFQLLTQVHEGTKFEIVETRGDWVSVKLANGKGGFVRMIDLGKV